MPSPPHFSVADTAAAGTIHGWSGFDSVRHQSRHKSRTCLMANENNKNPTVKQPGENPDGKYHFNPGNMAGKKPGDAKQTDENRGKPHEPEEKPAD
jgi:hypothetical protein